MHEHLKLITFNEQMTKCTVHSTLWNRKHKQWDKLIISLVFEFLTIGIECPSDT